MDKGNDIDYIDDRGIKHSIKDYDMMGRVKADRDKGDYTEILLRYAKNRKLIKLHTWVYKGMVGRVLSVDLKTRVFEFYNLTTETVAYYSLNIVRGVEEIKV